MPYSMTSLMGGNVRPPTPVWPTISHAAINTPTPTAPSSKLRARSVTCPRALCPRVRRRAMRSARRRARETRVSAASPARGGRGKLTSRTIWTRPGRALITTTRSARKTASSTAWVTSIVLIWSWVQMRCSSMFRRRLVTASRAPNGSSSSSISGSRTSARAIDVRWRNASGELTGPGLGEVGEADELEEFLYPLVVDGLSGHMERDRDVGVDGGPGQQRRGPGRPRRGPACWPPSEGSRLRA